jgi:hypothetical protein
MSCPYATGSSLSAVIVAGSGTSPRSTPTTATAWNSSPFIACMVPAMTACAPPRALSGVVTIPAALSASRASRTRSADRAVTPMADGSMPRASHERTCSASQPNSCDRFAATRSRGGAPCTGER